MPRKKQVRVDAEVARTIGGLLRDLRRTAGYRAVKDAAAKKAWPAAQQTIYAYERGGPDTNPATVTLSEPTSPAQPKDPYLLRV